MSAEKIGLPPCPFCGGTFADGTLSFSHGEKYIDHSDRGECSAFRGVLIRTSTWSTRAPDPEIARLTKERDDAWEALRFYADPNHDGYSVGVTDYGMSTEEGPIIRDGGAKARATLEAAGQ